MPLEKPTFRTMGQTDLAPLRLMQGLADGYFVLPYTIGDYLSDDIRTGPIPTDSPEFDAAEKAVKDRLKRFSTIKEQLGGLLPQESWVKSCGISVVCPETQKD